MLDILVCFSKKTLNLTKYISEFDFAFKINANFYLVSHYWKRYEDHSEIIFSNDQILIDHLHFNQAKNDRKICNILQLDLKNYLTNNESLIKISLVQLLKKANLSFSGSLDYRTFPHNSVTKKCRTICNVLKHSQKNYLSNNARPIKNPSVVFML